MTFVWRIKSLTSGMGLNDCFVVNDLLILKTDYLRVAVGRLVKLSSFDF